MIFGKSFYLRSKLQIRSQEFWFYDKHQDQGAIIKIVEMGPGTTIDQIYIKLDAAIDLNDKLKKMERLYQAIRPLPRESVLCHEDIADDSDIKYQVDLSVEEYRQILKITQIKPIRTRAYQSNVITVRDIGRFTSHLSLLLEEISEFHQRLVTEDAGGGIPKVVRGKRVAVIYCNSRPWPWTRSYQVEKLLFDPELVALIQNHDLEGIRHYCEVNYPNMLIDDYVNMNDEDNYAIDYENLNIRWVRKGKQFRINDLAGMVSLKDEDDWYTA